MRRFIAAACVLAAVAGTAAAEVGRQIQIDPDGSRRLLVDPPDAPAARLLVKVGKGATGHDRGRAPIDAVARRLGVSHRPLLSRAVPQGRAARAAGAFDAVGLPRWHVLEGQGGRSARAMLSACRADPDVEACEEDRTLSAALVPNDPYLSSSGRWGQPFGDLWGALLIDAPLAWEVTRGGGVVVAVVDTGVDATHPDIAANVWTNPGEIPGNGIDDDGNGFVDDVHGWNFVDDDADSSDDHFHGTHVAGTIAAVGGNAAGIVGVAYQSRILPVKGLDKNGSGYTSTLVDAVVYAVDNGADVINASWGGAGPSQVLSDVVHYAHDAGVVFVASAGNSNADAAGFTPADAPDAVTVAASDHLDVRASFSNYGIKIDVTAPGGGDAAPPSTSPQSSILSLLSSTYNRDQLDGALIVDHDYLRLAGTSMAAPHVSAVAALVRAIHPTYDVEDVRQVLRTTAMDVGTAGPDDDSGYGRIDAAAAVVAPAPLRARITSPALDEHIDGADTFDVVGSAAGPGFESYVLEYGAGDSPITWAPIVGPVTAPVVEGTLGTWNVSAVTNGHYVLRLTVTRGAEQFVDRVRVRVAQAVIDTPEPLAAIRAGGPLEIRGSAAGGGFAGYRVEYRRPTVDPDAWTSDGITLTSPTAPVRRDVLATFDTSTVTQGDRYDFRLVVDYATTEPIEVRRSGIVLDPTLKPGWPQPIRGVSESDYLTVADVDGDGHPEVVVGSGGEVTIFRADGSVLPGWPQAVLEGVADSSPLVADVSGDARPEVITSDHHRLYVWSADGVLQPGFPLASQGFRGLNVWIAAADFDGDGKDEIVISGIASLAVHHGDGSPYVSWLIGQTDMPVAIADVLGDARPEIATYGGYFVYKIRRYSGSLRDPGFAVLSGFPKGMKGSFFTHIGLADLDGDGHADLALMNENRAGKFKARATTPAGRPIRLTRFHLPHVRVRGSTGLLAYADVDRDGRAEAYTYVNTVGTDPRFLPGLAPDIGYFFAHEQKPAPLRPLVGHAVFRGGGLTREGGVAIGDLDGDGSQDLVAGTYGLKPCGLEYGPCSGEYLYLGVVAQHQDGTPIPNFPKPLPIFVASDDPDQRPSVSITVSLDDPRYNTPAITDLDGDGIKEVVWVDPTTSRIFAWEVPGIPGPLVADWPMYHHDPEHSNALPTH